MKKTTKRTRKSISSDDDVSAAPKPAPKRAMKQGKRNAFISPLMNDLGSIKDAFKAAPKISW